MSKVFIEAPGILAPGIADWAAFSTNGQTINGSDLPKLVAERLPRAERRRATQITRLAFMVGEQSLATSSAQPEEFANVFASSCSSTDIVDSVCMQLCDDPMLVSPTQFHNSVHNAPVGYWSIATGSKQPSNSICGHDHSFAAGLLEAYSQTVTEHYPTMVIAADMSITGRLEPFRDIATPFASSFVLTPAPTSASIAALSISLGDAGRDSGLSGELEALRLSNPAARSLPLLVQLATGNFGASRYTFNGSQLIAELTAL